MIEKIAYNLGRADEEPNIALAIELCNTKNVEGIKEIVDGLTDKNKQVASDCIKILYEIGERNPELIADYIMNFILLLKSSNNRLIWGGMMALSKIASLKSKEVFDNVDTIIRTYENGSVITRDNSISVFAKLASADKEYEQVMFSKIIEHLETCKPKEVAQHAERAFICVNAENSNKFINVLSKRREDLSDAGIKRVDKLIKRIKKGNFQLT